MSVMSDGPCPNCGCRMYYNTENLDYRCPNPACEKHKAANVASILSTVKTKSKECMMCLTMFVTDSPQTICKSCQKVADKVKTQSHGPDVHAEVSKLTDDMVKRQAARKADVVELSRHSPSVVSVISRLNRHQDEIKNLIVFIEYENGSCQVANNNMPVNVMAYGAMAVNHTLSKVMFEELGGG